MPFFNERAQGRPDANRTRSLVCENKNTRGRHHRYAGAFRPSLRSGLNGLLRALPGDRALLPPLSARRSMRLRKLDASVGAPGPHGFAVRKTSFVRILKRMLR